MLRLRAGPLAKNCSIVRGWAEAIKREWRKGYRKRSGIVKLKF